MTNGRGVPPARSVAPPAMAAGLHRRGRHANVAHAEAPAFPPGGGGRWRWCFRAVGRGASSTFSRWCIRTTITRPAPRTTASRWCPSCPTAASSPTATARCWRATIRPTRWRSPVQGGRPGQPPSRSSPGSSTSSPRPQALRKLMDESQELRVLPIRNRLTRRGGGPLHRSSATAFPGVEIKARLFRDYPIGSLRPTCIGYIGRINDRDLERIEGTTTPPTTGAPTTSARPASRRATSATCTADRLEEVEVDSGGRAVRPCGAPRRSPGNNLC